VSVAWSIRATNGAYLRESMRTVDHDENVREALLRAAEYIGEDDEIVRWDDGRLTCGALIATPVKS